MKLTLLESMLINILFVVSFEFIPLTSFSTWVIHMILGAIGGIIGYYIAKALSKFMDNKKEKYYERHS